MKFVRLAVLAALLPACGSSPADPAVSEITEALSSSGSGAFCNAAGPPGSILGPCISVPGGNPHAGQILTTTNYAGPGGGGGQGWNIVASPCAGTFCNRNFIRWVNGATQTNWWWGVDSFGHLIVLPSQAGALQVEFEEGGICAPGHGCLDTVGGVPVFDGGSIIDLATQTWNPVGFPIALVANLLESPLGSTNYGFWTANTPGASVKVAPGSDNCLYQSGVCQWAPPSQGVWELYPALFNNAWTLQLGPASLFGGNDSNVYSDATSLLTNVQSAHTAWSMRFYSNGVPALACSDETTYIGLANSNSAFISIGGSPSSNTVWPIPGPAPQ